MNELLEKINKEINNSDITAWNILDVLDKLKSHNDKISKIISKYYYDNNKTFVKVEDDDLEIVIETYDLSYNVLIRAILDYLIANSKKRSESKLVDDCLEVIKLYFQNIGISKPLGNMILIIILTIKKFPNTKENLKNILLDELLNNSFSSLEIFITLNAFWENNEIRNFFNNDEYCLIFEKYYLKSVDKNYVEIYLTVYSNYIDYLGNFDKDRRKIFIRKYIDFVFENINNIQFYNKQTLLPTIRDYMNELGDYSDADYCFIDEKIEKVNQETLKLLKKVTIDIPNELKPKYFEYIDKQVKKYEKLNNCDKLNYLLWESAPIHMDEIKKNNEERANSITSLFPKYYIDLDGNIINYKTLNENENFSVEAIDWINTCLYIYNTFILSNFFQYYKNNNESEKYIKQILSNNLLVSPDKIEYLSALFIDFFKQDFKNSVYNIVEEFEESLRFYFKNLGMNIRKRNKTNDFIGLNNIFNDYEKNNYRDKLLEVIDENYYFTLKWFLVDKYGFNLKNKVSHRYEYSNDLYNSIFSIYAVIQIFRLYWGFQKS